MPEAVLGVIEVSWPIATLPSCNVDFVSDCRGINSTVAFAFKWQLFRVFVFLLLSDFSGCSEVRGADSHIRLVPITLHYGYSELEDSFVTTIGKTNRGNSFALGCEDSSALKQGAQWEGIAGSLDRQMQSLEKVVVSRVVA
jgi:hypothetical protein